MGKIKEWIKEVKLVASIIKTIVAVIMCIVSFTPVMRFVIRQENEPIHRYIYSEIEKLIYKSVDKIKDDPEDVKIVDIETSLNNWNEFLKDADIPNKAVLEQKIVILQKWYAEYGGKS